MRKTGSFIWLIGENLGETRSNNSFYFWKHLTGERADNDVDAFLVLKKNEANMAFFEGLSNDEKRLVVWRNSLRHHILYAKADMLFVTLSYLDVVPDELWGKKEKLWAEAPVVYLQHGVSGMKRIGYNSHSYNNNLFRFVYYNRFIADSFRELNGMKDYQLLYGAYMPRWQELVKRFRTSRGVVEGNEVKEILWFLTWREYGQNTIETKKLRGHIKAVLSSDVLSEHLVNNGVTLKVVCHQLMSSFVSSSIKDLSRNCNVRVREFSEVDLLDEIAHADRLITDYSSVAYDFAFLGKPVLLFQPDFCEYTAKRRLYCSEEDLWSAGVHSAGLLVDSILKDDFKSTSFFRKAFPEKIDYEGVANGEYIERLCDYFLAVQRNKITFLGYNFWGVGGTVSATRALAEALAEKGFCVKMLSLKRLGGKMPIDCPPAVNHEAFYVDGKSKRKKERIKRLLARSPQHMKIISRDCNIKYLIPWSGFMLKRFLRTDNSKVIVSTRESFHCALRDSGLPCEKVYFFHTTEDLLDEIYPGILTDFSSGSFGKALFTTKRNRDAILEHEINVSASLVLGNTLQSSRMLTLDEACELRAQRHDGSHSLEEVVFPELRLVGKIKCVSLLRFSKEREEDLEKIISFARFLQAKGSKDIVLFVYGSGVLLDDFIERVLSEGLNEIILIKGATKAPARVIRNFDLLVDFSSHQSFGMTSLEGIFNGAIPLSAHNTGSLELYSGCPELLFESWAELEEKIRALYAVDEDRFRVLYLYFYKGWSREVLSTKFIEFVFGSSPLLSASSDLRSSACLPSDVKDA